MRELKCPKCGNVFTVNEDDYAIIANQVKNAEFNSEVERRIAELHQLQRSEQEKLKAEIESEHQKELTKKAKEINEKDSTITQLQEKLNNIELLKASELELSLAKKDEEISELKSQLAQKDEQKKVAVLEEQSKSKDALNNKDLEIQQLKAEIELQIADKDNQLSNQKDLFENKLKIAQNQIDYYKDLKTKMSTKMVGETLEQHCKIEYEKYLRVPMSQAYFDKDNTIVDGTKGDFIFRDYDDGMEYISIMFEMKNESDDTSKKHKNEEFLKKLDSDRNKKKCEYAVLVSLLEPDNELYNNGIVDVSHLYPKMYVIRPQFFIPLITLLVQTSKKSLEYKKQLVIAQSKEVDVTNFENKLIAFRNKFGDHYTKAAGKFDDAINKIDEAIKKLQAIKKLFEQSEKYLGLANKDANELTIKKLTYKNPTMKAMFEKARVESDLEPEDEA